MFNVNSFQPDELLSEIRSGVLVLTINRLPSYNAWTSALRDELARHIIAAGKDDAIEAVVLTGAGTKAFCSGQDLSELQAFSDGRNIEMWLHRLTKCYDAIRRFRKPLVAAVNGVAAGSGFQVTQFCDVVVTCPEARLGQTEVNSGLPSIFGTWLMWERVGRRAVELALRGRLMAADEAKALGFVHEVVPQSQVLDTALVIAERLAAQPKVAYGMSKDANRLFDEERYSRAMTMAGKAYREAFNEGAPQEEIKRFFERRHARKAAAQAG